MAESVSLKEHMEALREADNRRFDDLRSADMKAVDTALQRANEMVAQHNDLIRKGERDAANYVTKEQNALQFKGLAIALGAVASLAAVIVSIIMLTGGA